MSFANLKLSECRKVKPEGYEPTASRPCSRQKRLTPLAGFTGEDKRADLLQPEPCFSNQGYGGARTASFLKVFNLGEM